MNESNPSFDASGLAGEKRRSFWRGMSIGLLFPAVGWCLWMALATVWDVPQFAEIFRNIGVEVPLPTRLIMDWYGAICAVLVAAALACLTATAIKGERPMAAILNASVFLLVLGYQAILHVALMGPLLAIQRRLGE